MRMRRESGVGICLALGAGIGAAMGNVPTGIAVGLAVGAAFAGSKGRADDDDKNP